MSYADKYGHSLETGTAVRTSKGDYGVVSSLFMKSGEQWATVQGPYMSAGTHEFPTRNLWKQDTDVGAQEGGSSMFLQELVSNWKGRQILHDGTWKEKTTIVPFNNGDVLKFRDDGDNAVVWIGSITYSCALPSGGYTVVFGFHGQTGNGNDPVFDLG